MKGFGELANAILKGGAKKATRYFSENEVLKATYQGKRNRKASQHTIIFTLGRPNFEEKEFIRRAKEAKEPFPVKKIQLKFEKDGKSE